MTFKVGDKIVIVLKGKICLYGDYFDGDIGTITELHKEEDISVCFDTPSKLTGEIRENHLVSKKEAEYFTKLHKAML